MIRQNQRHKQFFRFLLLLLIGILLWKGAVQFFFHPDVRLISAARKGDVRGVRQALAKGADVTTRSEHWRCGFCTPLEFAIAESRIPEIGKETETEGKREYIEIAQVLLDHGVDVNAKERHLGKTPLMRAVSNVDMLALLLDYGAELESRNPYGMTALALAAERTSTAMLLIQAGADITVTDRDGETLLMKSAEGGSLPLVEYFVNHGLDVNAEGGARYTALMRAIYNGHAAIAKFLLEHGADPNKVDNMGSTALMKAARHGYSDGVKDLAWEIDVVKLLLEYGADVNASFRTGGRRTALMSAAEGGNIETARVLLEHGASVQGNIGRAVLRWQLTSRWCEPEFLALLRSYGVEVTDQDRCKELKKGWD